MTYNLHDLMHSVPSLTYSIISAEFLHPSFVEIPRIPLPDKIIFLLSGIYDVTGGARVEIMRYTFSKVKVIAIILNDPNNHLALGFKPWIFNNTTVGTQIAGALFEIREAGLGSITDKNCSPSIMNYLNEFREAFGKDRQTRILISDELINNVDSRKYS